MIGMVMTLLRVLNLYLCQLLMNWYMVIIMVIVILRGSTIMKRLVSYLPLLLFSFSIFCGIFSSSSIDSYAYYSLINNITLSDIDASSFTYRVIDIDYEGQNSSIYSQTSPIPYYTEINDSSNLYTLESNNVLNFNLSRVIQSHKNSIKPDRNYRFSINLTPYNSSTVLNPRFLSFNYTRNNASFTGFYHNGPSLYVFISGQQLLDRFNDYLQVEFTFSGQVLSNSKPTRLPVSKFGVSLACYETDDSYGINVRDDGMASRFDKFTETFNDRFIPSDGSSASADGQPSGENNAFGGVYSTLYDTMEEKLGFLSFPFMLLVSLLDGISSDGSFSGITFPEISWQGQTIIPETLVTFPDIGIQDTIYFVTDIVLIGWFIILLQNKLREVLTK